MKMSFNMSSISVVSKAAELILRDNFIYPNVKIGASGVSREPNLEMGKFCPF